MKQFFAAAFLLGGAHGNKLKLDSEAAATSLDLESASLHSAYASFLGEHGMDRSGDSVAYAERLRAFARTRARVERQNSKADRSWTATMNRFADYTPSEIQHMMGYRRLGQWWNNTSSLVQETQRGFADSINWAEQTKSGKYFVDQGACGSCWAVASIGALEMHAEIATKQEPGRLSYKELVDCVPNPQHCGGDGGCMGATGELAFEYISQHGLSAAMQYTGNLETTDSCRTSKRAAHVKATSFVKLPVNKLNPLMQALQKGPVVVSVDGAPWMSYEGGVFDDCSQDATVNHAVLMLGYGHDTQLKKDYWLLRNSWGEFWGEAGFIRILRHNSDEGDAGYCGTDYEPKQGVGCTGGPATLPVCGMCGILSDSVYPDGVTDAK